MTRTHFIRPKLRTTRNLTVWAFFCLTVVSASADQRLENLAESRFWHLLLHYHRGMFGGSKSKAVDGAFFLSPVGRTDPMAELKADLEAFSKPLTPPQKSFEHAQCKFPERYLFLKRELGLANPDVDCAELRKWKAEFGALRVSLLFASAYMNSPASVAGHSFLKLSPKTDNPQDAASYLHDQVIVYSAVTGESAGLAYLFRGVFGGFPGEFSSEPYYDTVHTYLNFEQRDLWEYELALTDEQRDRMIGHLWELHWTHFNYYFFDENCSYQLMALLEVANPDWHLIDRFHFIVNPADTIRALNDQPGAIREVRYRPSLYKKLLKRYQSLSDSEQKAFRERMEDGPPRLVGDESAAFLDTAIDYSIYSNLRQKRNAGIKPSKDFLPGAAQMPAGYYKLLQARASLPVVSESSEVEVPAPGRPDLGHPISRIAFDFGARRNQRFAGTSLRYAYHDLLNPDHGYLKGSQIEFLKLDLHEIFPERRFRLRELTLADGVVLEPMNSINYPLSWRFSAGVYSPTDIDCKNCNAGQISLGLGLSTALLPANDDVLLFVLPGAAVEYSGWYQGNFRFGPTVSGGVLFSGGDWAKALLTEEAFYYPTQTGQAFYHRLSGRAAAMLGSRYELRVSAARYFSALGAYYDTQIAMGFYL